MVSRSPTGSAPLEGPKISGAVDLEVALPHALTDGLELAYLADIGLPLQIVLLAVLPVEPCPFFRFVVFDGGTLWAQDPAVWIGFLAFGPETGLKNTEKETSILASVGDGGVGVSVMGWAAGRRSATARAVLDSSPGASEPQECRRMKQADTAR